MRGISAWNVHVARHLDGASQRCEGNVPFGAPNDEMLVRWASSPEVGVIQMQSGTGFLIFDQAFCEGKARPFEGVC